MPGGRVRHDPRPVEQARRLVGALVLLHGARPAGGHRCACSTRANRFGRLLAGVAQRRLRAARQPGVAGGVEVDRERRQPRHGREADVVALLHAQRLREPVAHAARAAEVAAQRLVGALADEAEAPAPCRGAAPRSRADGLTAEEAVEGPDLRAAQPRQLQPPDDELAGRRAPGTDARRPPPASGCRSRGRPPRTCRAPDSPTPGTPGSCRARSTGRRAGGVVVGGQRGRREGARRDGRQQRSVRAWVASGALTRVRAASSARRTVVSRSSARGPSRRQRALPRTVPAIGLARWRERTSRNTPAPRWRSTGIEVDEVDLAVMSVAEGVYGPEREALLAADLSDVPLEHDFDPSRAADGRRDGGRASSDHPQDLSLREQARAIAAGELDATELLEATLSRIEERDGPVNSIVDTFASESARMLSEAPEGPLHGVPIAVKDMFTLPWRAPRDGAPRNLQGFGPGRVRRLPAAARRGRGDRRRHQHARVRRGLDRPPLGLRAVRHPLGHGALRRRVVGRLGRRGRRAPGRGRGRHRRRRLDPLPGRLLRDHRAEAHLGRSCRRTATRTATRRWARPGRCAATPPTRACSARRSLGRPLEERRATNLRLGIVRDVLGRRRPRGRTSTARPRSSGCARAA